MCDTCGCGEGGHDTKITVAGKEHKNMHRHADGSWHIHEHHHVHEHEPNHEHHHQESRLIEVEEDILSKNNRMAERNRGWFEAKKLLAFNLMSSPGSGKTSLLERTIKEKGKAIPFFVIEGDQQTLHDAERIDHAGAPAIQINTGNGCHLDAAMIRSALDQFTLKEQAILMIENVGNLVCPSLFDLGESKRIVIISTTEGDDKPAKYPTMFQSADLCIINKIDLLPYVDFDMEKAKEYAKRLQPDIEFLELSVRTGEGIDKWYDWLNRAMKTLTP